MPQVCNVCGWTGCSGSCVDKKINFSETLSVGVIGPLDYWDEHLSAHITSHEQRKRLMKERGLREGRSNWDSKIVSQKKQQAGELGISVSELEHRFSRQAIK